MNTFNTGTYMYMYVYVTTQGGKLFASQIWLECAMNTFNTRTYVYVTA